MCVYDIRPAYNYQNHLSFALQKNKGKNNTTIRPGRGRSVQVDAVVPRSSEASPPEETPEPARGVAGLDVDDPGDLEVSLLEAGVPTRNL